jgi:outer membrane protein assembly factor BamB
MFVWLIAGSLSAEDWPQFRGPTGQGHSQESGVPLEWSETDNIVWKTPIPGLGWSSPVISRGMIWLTSGDEETGSLRAIAIKASTGEILHDVEVFHKDDLGRISHKNTHASPTPVLDGDHIYVHYGAHGTACLNRKGEIVWKIELAHDHRHGPGGSPVVCRDTLVVVCDGFDRQFIVGIDKSTGRVRWQQDRGGQMAYSTPLAIRTAAGEQVVAVGGGATVAYHPQTGQEFWRCRFEGHSVVPRPVHHEGLLYFCTGYWTPSLVVLRTDGSGDVTDSHVVGRLHRAVPFTTSPIVVGQSLYMVSDMGVLTCVDTTTGNERWHKRLGGNYSASPVHADGKIYFVNEDAKTTVLAAGSEYEVLATNQLDGRGMASPAISGRAMYFRTDTHLYKIQDNKDVASGAASASRK